jgi:hypothetical protein
VVTVVAELVEALRQYLPKIVDRPSLLRAAECDQAVDLTGLAELGILDAAAELGLTEAELAEVFAAAGEHSLPAAAREAAGVTVPLLATAGGEWAAGMLRRLRAGSIAGGGGGSLEPTGTPHQVWLGRDAAVAAVVAPDRAVAFDCRHATIEPRTSVDPGQGAAWLSGEPAAEVRGPAARTLWRRWQLLLLADTLGCGRAVLHRARDYAVERHQFGRPIAAFQAVAHLLADMYVGVSAGTALLARVAALAPDNETELAAAACWLPARMRRVCEQGIQVHGGNGYTWEFGLHLHYRRVLAIQATLGGRYGAAARAAGTGVAG